MITSSKISKRKKRSQRLAFGLFRLTSLLVVAILVWILGFIIVKGAGVVSWEFLTSMPENGMTEGGILPAIVGTLCLVAGSIAVAFPLGVMSGIHVSEYALRIWVKQGLLPAVFTGNRALISYANAVRVLTGEPMPQAQ